MPLVERSPQNPILWPNRANDWEAEAAFNGCAFQVDGHIHLVYRAESSPRRVADADLRLATIGHATSEDGTEFADRRQILRPERDWERYGCEDPRITRFEDKYYLFYTALSRYPFAPDGIRVGVAVSPDLHVFDRHLVTPFNAKAMALFPERVDGKIAALLTANTDRPPARVALALFDGPEEIWSREYWEKWYPRLDSHSLPLQRTPDDHVELGAPPVLTREGWLVFYSHIRDYFHPARLFGVEAVLLDRDNPLKILGRTERPILIPEKGYEQYGRVPNVTFPSGALVRDGRVHIYYGAADTTCCLATCDLDRLLEEMRTHSLKMVRFEGNPILASVPDHPWEQKAVFNPGILHADNRVHLLYRAMSQDDTSVLGYASSLDGFHIGERLADPVYVPREHFERPAHPGVGSGCEDPRLTVIDDRVHMLYTAFDGVNPPRVAHSSILLDDFLAKDWDWTIPTLASGPGVDDKDAAIFPGRVGGKYAVLHRLGASIWLDLLPDLQFEGRRWLGGKILLDPGPGFWDGKKIGICGPPIETDRGWLLLYHGVSNRPDHHYHLKAALLAREDPMQVLARTKYPFLEPEKVYERVGQVPNVVFSCGAAVVGDLLHVYYGGADQVIGVATHGFLDFVDRLWSEHRV